MKVTLIRTGGTIGCLKGDDGVIALSPATDIHLDGFDLDVQTPFYELSERIGVSHYDKLVKAVLSAAADSEAIIITHGSDTLPYTASVLAFALGKTNIPIVFVCSDKPLTEKDASGHRSLSHGNQSGKKIRLLFGIRLMDDSLVAFAGSPGLVGIDSGNQNQLVFHLLVYFGKPADVIADGIFVICGTRTDYD